MGNTSFTVLRTARHDVPAEPPRTQFAELTGAYWLEPIYAGLANEWNRQGRTVPGAPREQWRVPPDESTGAEGTARETGSADPQGGLEGRREERPERRPEARQEVQGGQESGAGPRLRQVRDVREVRDFREVRDVREVPAARRVREIPRARDVPEVTEATEVPKASEAFAASATPEASEVRE
ncbi:hypothetical protein [Streptomyces marispadix]|uniref:DUF2382 domain-containing protein n=1 Tax=Streptomyces marispadix TaxID=2922868 RepID=A0ABS9SX93_9ACTN|nr:hypothetical protein [Streptomyces marispadix]MCH6160895.1 hypothetical protein [Streptomyces marispadix]